MPKPSRYNDRFAHLQQHYEATEPRWLKVEREKTKAVAEVMSALNPRPKYADWESVFLDMLTGRSTGMVVPAGTVIQDLVINDKAADFKLRPIKLIFDDIEATNGYSRSPTGRIRR